jgi:hypothetical protein
VIAVNIVIDGIVAIIVINYGENGCCQVGGKSAVLNVDSLHNPYKVAWENCCTSR